jgi:hypothetical protein
MKPPQMSQIQAQTTIQSFRAEPTIDKRVHGIKPEHIELLSTLPFWINDKAEHKKKALETGQKCCFNHYIGLPKKQGREYPLFDYEFDLMFNAYEQHDTVWILKSRGLGVTEFTIRWMLWKCMTGDPKYFRYTQIAIIVGPREETAKDLVTRIRRLFRTKLGIWFDTKIKEIILPLNYIQVITYPSNHVDALRSYANVTILCIDEAEFFVKKEQSELEAVIHSYREKSNAKIIMVSTPHMPGGLFERIDKDQNSSFHKLRLDYTYGMDKIYKPERILEMKQELSFEREYNLKYLGEIGNVFHTLDIEAAEKAGKLYDPFGQDSISPFYGRSMGVDEGFGSSAFGIVICQFRDNMIEVIYAEDFTRPLHHEMIERIIKLNNRHHIGRILVDSSNAGFVQSLKQRIGDHDYKTYPYINERSGGKAGIINDINDPKLRGSGSMIKVFPVNFGKCHKDMLFHAHTLLKDRKLRINPCFDKLFTALRTAKTNDSWSLDKEATAYDDILDSFRLALLNYYFTPRTVS